MASVVATNIRVVGVEGSSDDTDIPIEECFEDTQYKNQQSLGSVNSVNIGRLLVQVAHFFHSYTVVCQQEALDHGAAMDFFVPTGGGGPDTSLRRQLSRSQTLHY